MNENSVFYWPRFVKLLRKEVLEHGKTFLLRVLALYGVFTVLLVWYASTLYSSLHSYSLESLQHHLYRNSMHILIAIFLGAGILSASFLMEGMRTKTSRIHWLMTPGTVFEKYLTRWFLFIFLFLPLCWFLFTLADYTRCLVIFCFFSDQPLVGPTPVIQYLIEGEGHFGMFHNWTECIFAGSFMYFIHSLFALGSTLWMKNSILKTFTLSLLLFLVYLVFGVCLFTIVFDEDMLFIPPEFITQLSAEQVCLIFSAVLWCFTLFHWILGYYRFKESEIINRW